MAIPITEEDREDQARLRMALKNLREGQLLSQRDISARMEMAQGNFNRLENGENDIKLVNFMAWARALGYSLVIKLDPLEGPEEDAFDLALTEVFGA